jgi:hypothetical protein
MGIACLSCHQQESTSLEPTYPAEMTCRRARLLGSTHHVVRNLQRGSPPRIRPTISRTSSSLLLLMEPMGWGRAPRADVMAHATTSPTEAMEGGGGENQKGMVLFHLPAGLGVVVDPDHLAPIRHPGG